MDLTQIAGYLAGVIYAIAAGYYVIDVAKQKVRVSIAAYLMFALINASQLVSLISESVWGSIPFTIVGLTVSVAICFLSLRNKKVYIKFIDKIGFAGALIGFIVWQIADDPTLNIYILSFTTVLVVIPVIVKTFMHPSYETAKPWRINLLAATFLLLTINSGATVVWIIPAREFLFSLLMNIGIALGNKRV